MARRAIHIDPDGRWGRALAAIVAPRRPPAPRFVMICIGCGDAKPPGWARPGLCWGCDQHAAKHVRCTRRVQAMIVQAAVAALRTGRRTFRVSSLLVLAFHGGGDLLEIDANERKAGSLLDPTTTVRICRDRSWATKLVWRRREAGVKFSSTQGIRFRGVGRARPLRGA